jgi:hypothetical protein
MNSPIRYAAPDTLPRERPASRCRRACCWTPHGHSAAARGCLCHEGDPMADHVPIGVLRLLNARDGRSCIMTGTETERLVPQHRQGGMGGRANKHRLANLVWLDSIFNGLITSDPQLQKLAKVWGVTVSLHGDVEEIPVFRPHMRQWFLLRGDTRFPITPLEALDRMHAFYGDDYFAWKADVERPPGALVLALRGAL